MKRFYKTVELAEAEDGYAIHLDGKDVKTPTRAPLVTPNKALAENIAAEWEAQGEVIDPETMPLTQLLNTKIDRIGANRAALQSEVMKFLDTDLICYYTDAPSELLARQKAAWNGGHLWFAEKSGESLQTTQDIAALRQSQKAHDFAQSYIDALDDDRFTILQIAVPLCGSLVLALGFVDGALSAEDMRKAAFVEEDYKSELYHEDQYGEDPHLEKKRKAFERDMQAAETYLRAL